MGLILFGVFILLLVIGVPVAFSICTAAGVTVLSGLGQGKLLILIQRMFEACNSFSLIAVPFFILAGDLLSKGKISKLLVEFCESLLGILRGGLSVVSVLAGMFFAAISGSGAATTAAVGGTLVPELKRRGYPEAEAAALIAAAGTIGVVIPPSVPMVLYAVIAEESVNRLFKAGFLPGVLMGIALIGHCPHRHCAGAGIQKPLPEGDGVFLPQYREVLCQSNSRHPDAADYSGRNLFRIFHPLGSRCSGCGVCGAGIRLYLQRSDAQGSF